METRRAVSHARRLTTPGGRLLPLGPSDVRFDLEAHPRHWFRTLHDCLCPMLKQLEGTAVPILCWRGLGNNSQLRSHWAMCAPPLADASLDRRLQNAYKSTRRGRTPVKLGALRRRRRGEEALRTRGAPKTPGARVSR